MFYKDWQLPFLGHYEQHVSHISTQYSKVYLTLFWQWSPDVELQLQWWPRFWLKEASESNNYHLNPTLRYLENIWLAYISDLLVSGQKASNWLPSLVSVWVIPFEWTLKGEHKCALHNFDLLVIFDEHKAWNLKLSMEGQTAGRTDGWKADRYYPQIL